MYGMGKCEVYNDKVWQDYLQNRLRRKEMDEMQFHLHHCAFCRERLKQMRSMIRDIQITAGNSKKKISRIQAVLRFVAVVTLILSFSVGGYYFTRHSSGGSTIVITPAPVHDSIDSVKTTIDSVEVIDKKDTIQYHR